MTTANEKAASIIRDLLDSNEGIPEVDERQGEIIHAYNYHNKTIITTWREFCKEAESIIDELVPTNWRLRCRAWDGKAWVPYADLPISAE